MEKIIVKQVLGFIDPLKYLSQSVESIIFSIKDGYVSVNTKSDDRSQIANIKWDKDIVEAKTDKELKLGIYNLQEFLRTLELFESPEISLSIDKNRMNIKFISNKTIKICYILSDIETITEGPEGPKKDIDYEASFKVENNFLKKISKISSSIGSDTLKLKCKKGTISYAISDRYFSVHSHMIEEILNKKTDFEDFDYILDIEKLKFIPSNSDLIINISNNVINFELTDNSALKLGRYYVAPLIQESNDE